MKNKLLNTNQLAKVLGISSKTLSAYRRDGTGPEYVKLGHLVRYQMEDVQAWLEEKKKPVISLRELKRERTKNAMAVLQKNFR